MIEKYKDLNYIVELVRGSRKREIYHVNKLSPCYTREAVFESTDDGDESNTEIEVRPEPQIQEPPDIQSGESTEIYDYNQTSSPSEAINAQSNSDTIIVSNETVPRRSARINKGIPPIRFSPTLTALGIALYLFALAFGDFHKVSPIIWRHTGKPVLVGVHPVQMAIKYFSPCNLLSDPQLLPFGSQAPLFNWCNTSFYADFIKPVRNMCPRIQRKSSGTEIHRSKRVIALLGLGAIVIGAAASIGLSSVAMAKTSSLEDKFDSFEDQNRILMENLKQVLENDNVEKLALKRLKGEISQMSDYVNKISQDVGQLQKTLPTALIIMSKLGAQFSLTRNLLFEVSRKWRENELDPQLFQVFNVTLPCEGSCPLKFAKPKSCEWDEENGIIIVKFDLRVTQPKAHVLAADPFMLAEVNKTSMTWCAQEYSGPNLVVYDETLDCLVPTKGSNLDFANDLILKPDETYCQKRQVIASDKYWERKRCEPLNGVLEDDTVQVKNAGAQNYVFCHPFKVKLYDKLAAVECPNYVFSLPSNKSFRIGRFTYNANQINLKNQLIFAEDLSQRINFQISPKVGLLNLTDDFRSLDNLVDKIDTESREYVFSDLHWTITTGAILILCAILFGIYLRIIRSALIKRSKDGARLVNQEEVELMAFY